MTVNLDTLSFLHPETLESDEFSNPLDVSDIINICKEYSKLGMQIQNQVEQILELGVEESIKNNYVKEESLQHIKHFLTAIFSNGYLGDAAFQAGTCLKLISQHETKQKISKLN